MMFSRQFKEGTRLTGTCGTDPVKNANTAEHLHWNGLTASSRDPQDRDGAIKVE